MRVFTTTISSAVASCLLGLMISLPGQLQAYTTANLQTGSDGTIETIPLQATVQVSPPQITIETYAPGTFSIYRKDPGATTWGTAIATGVTLSATNTWTDTNVTVGTLYEYKFVNTAGTSYYSYPTGYILTGIQVDQTQPKGMMAVVVASDLPTNLPTEYAQYKSDLRADGWQVREIQVPRAVNYNGLGNGSIATVKVNAGGVGFATLTGSIIHLVNSGGKTGLGKMTANSSGTITAVSVPTGGGGYGFALNDSLTIPNSDLPIGSGGSLIGYVNTAQQTLKSASPVIGGSGYTNKETVTLTGQTSGKTAQATIYSSSGVIYYISVGTSQSGFVQNELVTMSGNTTGSGIGNLVGYVSNNLLISVVIYGPGTGYVQGDTGTLTGSISGKTAQVTLSVTTGGVITGFTVNSSQAGFSSGENLLLSGTSAGSGMGAINGTFVAALTSVTVNNGGSGYVNGDQVTISGSGGTATATLTVNGSGVITAITIVSSDPVFVNGSAISILGSSLQSPAGGYNLTVNTLDNSNLGESVIVGSGGSGYIDNDSITLKGNSSGATAVGSIIASGGAITGISVVLPSTFTPGETLTLTPASGGSGASATTSALSDLHILIRSAVQAVYNSSSGQLKNVVMVGKVPVCRSGIMDNYGSDGHGNECSYGADAFYAEMLGVIGVDWTDTGDNAKSMTPTYQLGDYNVPGDKQFDQQTIQQINKNGAGAVQLGFGRIDLSQTIQTEVEAERTYFNKLHLYKISDPSFQPGLRVCDRQSYANEREADLQSMPGVVGMNNIEFIPKSSLPTVQAGQDADQAYSAQHGPYIFYFKGDGDPQAGVGGKAVFWTGMQSHWGYWYQTSLQSSGSNAMQERLAENSFTLDITWNIWGLRYIYHRLGMGLDAGDMMKQSINNSSWSNGTYSYRFNNTNNGSFHGVLYMDQMGDPALRLFMFPPPSGLSVVKTGGYPVLSWTASTDGGVIGYHVYRAANANALFTRLTSTPVTGTTYTDNTATSGSYVYTVRAVRLETTGGGSFYNPSLGITGSINLDAAPSGVSITTTSLTSAFWNTPTTYTLAAQGGVPQYNWTVSSGTLPPGMNLSSLGVLSGTPATVGSYNFTVQVADQIGQTATQAYNLLVGSNSSNLIYPEATTYTVPTSPTTSYGTSEVNIVSGSAGGNSVNETFQRYNLSGLTTNNAIAKATLYLYVTSGTASGVYAPIQANMINDSVDGWVDLGVQRAFTGVSSAGAGLTLVNCPGHGFTASTQVTLAGLDSSGAAIGPYEITTVVDADNFIVKVAYNSAWAYDPALAYVTTTSLTYNSRPTTYDTSVPTLTGTGTDTAGTLIQFDVTSYVKQALTFSGKKMGVRFFTRTPQSISVGSLRSFGGSIPYMVVQTTDAPSIVFNSPTVNPAVVYTGSNLYLNTTVTPVSPRTATVQWSKVSGPGSVAFTSPTSSVTGASFSAAGDYVIQIAADDGVAQSYQTLAVRVMANPVNGPINNLVLRMPFDETSGTTAHDFSGVSPANSGTLTANPTSNPLPAWGSAGVIGNALSFAGTGQRVDVPDSAANLLDGIKQISFSMWIYANGLPVGSSNYAGLIAKRVAAFNKESYNIELRGSTAGTSSPVYVTIGGGTTLQSAVQVTTGKWYHVAVVYDGTQSTNNLQLYINGTPDKFTTITPTTVARNATANLHIGAFDTSDTAGFNGLIDEVRIYNTALTLSQIQDLYAAAPTNMGPVISTSPTLSGTVNISVPLTATVTDDGKPNSTLTYNWSQLSGPGSFNISNAAALTSSALPSQSGTYGLQFTASDGAITTFANVSAIITGQNFASWAVQKGLTGNNALPGTALMPDKLTNLFKYALGLDPGTSYNPGASGLPAVQPQNVSGNNYLTLSFNGTATDVIYKVQATSDLSGAWTTIQTFPSGTAPGAVTVQDTQPVTASPKRFMRLVISQP